MIQQCTTSKSSNRSWTKFWVLSVAVAAIQSLSVNSFAEFRNQRDREVAREILVFFASECTLKSATDEETLKRIKEEASDSQSQKIPEASKCFEDFISQITGVFYLYEKICSDVSANTSKVSDTTMARQLLEVNKYQTGIRPFHAGLNDCLGFVPDRKGKSFIVPLSGTEIDARAMQKELEEAKVMEPFPATIEPFR